MINIISAELVSVELENAELGSNWVCWLEVERELQTWVLPVTAPGDLSKAELKSHFGDMEDRLWALAERKQYDPNIYEYIKPRNILKAMVGVFLDELNSMRGQPEQLTMDGFEVSLRQKLTDLEAP